MEQTSLYRHLLRYPRSSEGSRFVVPCWGMPVDCHIPELPVASVENAKVCADYYALSAERLLYRGKVLGLSVDDSLASSEAVQSAHPFGQDCPDFATLSAPSVSLAMALVPLTPEGGGGKPILVRLYCAKGLTNSFPSPFTKGADSPELSGFSWFVAGLPDKLADEPVNGESWLLAAHLLKALLDRNQAASTKKNLATSFIVTGKVVNGTIGPVEMGRKPELAAIKEYRSLKWIIPMENTNDMDNVPSRFVEKPATLEEAYELIESMQSKATKSFFRFLRESNLEGMKEQFEIGADIFDDDPETHKGALQIAAEAQAAADAQRADAVELDQMRKELIREKKNGSVFIKALRRHGSVEKAVEKARRGKDIRQWLDSNGFVVANPKVLFAMAKMGMDGALEQVLERFPVNTRDENGNTAVDYALFEKDWASAQRLYSLGGCCDYKGMSGGWDHTYNFAFTNFEGMPDEEMPDEMRLQYQTMFVNALQVGMKPDARDLFSDAIMRGDVTLAEACIKAGRNPNNDLTWTQFNFVGESRIPILAIAENIYGNLDEGQQEALFAMLFRNGVEKTPELEHKIKQAMARSYVRQGDAHKIMLAIDDGLLSFEDDFTLDTIVDEIHDERSIRGSLFALALDRGWLDVVAKCLEKGASPSDELRTTWLDFEGGMWRTCVYEKGTPIDYVQREKRSLSTEKTRKIVALLQSYIDKNVGNKPEELVQD